MNNFKPGDLVSVKVGKGDEGRLCHPGLVLAVIPNEDAMLGRRGEPAIDVLWPDNVQLPKRLLMRWARDPTGD